ncbi:MAG: archaetidylserine decarboxylase [Thioalkalispiraceae bacterium]|jgi:phosphatidylserine decarboxylase
MQNKIKSASLGDYLFALPQYIIPHHLISRIVLFATRVKIVWFKNMLIRFVIRQYKVNMNELQYSDINHYACFNEFFTRPIKESARPVAEGEKVLCSPVDGAVSQVGDITDSTIFQAKGHQYSAKALLGGYEDIASQFESGKFATLYLSPRDYHRIHMPVAGTLEHMVYVPGRLFSVNPQTVRCIPGLFARNERVVTVFDTALGPMAMVLVGAINVGCIETVWQGVITPPHRQPVHRWVYKDHQDIQLDKGEEMGRFNMGSTVICLFANPDLEFDTAITPEASIKMGQAMIKLS